MTEEDLKFLRELGETINREAEKNDGEYIAIIQKRKWLVGHPDFVDDWGLCVEGEDVAIGLNEAKKYLINCLLDENLDTLSDAEKAKILDLISKIRDIEENQDLASFLDDQSILYRFSFMPLQETWEIPDKGLKITFDIDEAKKYVSDKPNLRYELIYLGGSNPQMQQLVEVLSRMA